jgi:DNA-binding beta-propeller fold protein YncE
MVGMRGGPGWGRRNAGIASAVVLLVLAAFVAVVAGEAGSLSGGVGSGSGLDADWGGGGAWGLSGDPMGVLPAPAQAVAGAVGPAVSEGAGAVAARARSRREFMGLDAARAERVDREAFPAQVAKAADGPASLPAGQRVTRLLSAHTAQIALGHGRRGAVESTQPMAVETSPGHLAPVDLALKRVGGVFESVRPVVGVMIPSRAREGVHLSDAGVSLTPVNAHGGSLGGSEGAIDGASVVYANTQTDEDTLVKPTTMGFSMDAVLRSADSPQQIYYRVGLPSGARLLQGHRGAPVQVVSDGVTLGVLMPPTAVDAAGANVPAAMSVLSGGLLSVTVQDSSGDYRYPVSVDPEYVTAEDRSLTGGVFPIEMYKGGTNWLPYHSAAFSEEHTYKESYSCGTEWYWCNQSWYIEPNREYNGGEYAGLQYRTQGESTIYNLEMWLEGYNEPSETSTEVEYTYCLVEKEIPCEKGEGRDNHVLLSGGKAQTEYKYEGEHPLSMTSGYFHNPLETPRHNAVRFMDYTTKHESLYGFWAYIWAARVYVAQEESKHPEAEPTTACPKCGFNTSSATIFGADGRNNVLYGSGSWLGPDYGAYEVTAHDPGIGVSFAALSGAGMSQERFIRTEEGKCAGIQCSQTYSSPATYLPTMAEGEDSIELFAEDAAGLYGYSDHTIKVDARPPEKLEVTGWPARREISAAMHTLTLSARDEGPSGAKSSGVKSITLSIDGGKEITVAGASCAEGPCTATGTYTLHAEDLSEGVHRLVETATDNAENVAPPKEYTFDVRHASPIAVGPGAVDPTTGQFTLGATDVSLGGVAAVARTYQSRDLTAGSEGPLGPQWSINLGASQSLVTLPEGAVALTASGGGRTTFTSKGKGEYEPPLGDENLTLESKEKEAGKGISEYLLKDFKAGTTTVFTQPVGTESTMPIYANRFGQEGVEMGKPVSAAIDASGDVWVTDYTKDRVLEFSRAGLLLKAFGSEGEYPNQFKEPWGIAINKSTGNVYVSDAGNSRIVELNSSGGFVRAFGWGVKPGGERREAFQDCTSYCQAGIAGTGAGQLDWPQGVAVDSSGNVWVAEYGSNRIQKFSAEGEYLGSYGAAGTGGGQFEGPMDLSFYGGDLYVSDQNNNRVQELTGSGAFVKAIGWGVSNGEAKLQVCTSGCRAGIAGAGNGQFNGPRGLAIDPSGNLYVSEINNNRVQELTLAGAFVTKFGSAGSGSGQFSEPMGLALGAQNEIYVADYVNKRMQEWMRPTWMPARTEDALKHVATAYAYEPVEVEGKVVIDPTEVLAATPAGITCVGEHGEVEIRFLKDGCRALSFNYASATTAKGEAPSEWGDYDGHLTRVYFHGYERIAKAMATREVAHYLYDAHGRLRGEWDPRTEPKPESDECTKELLAKGCLATVYGYDEAGHVTSVTPPGQESWGLVYGTIASDSETGRLLKVMRAPASAALWSGAAPVKTAAPALSGTPAVGTRMAASNGSWSNSPVVYGYQWEDCNSSGGECVAILGATNQNYTPVSGDVGHTLVAKVTATNGGGSVVAESTHSAVVAAQAGLYTQTVDSGYSLNAVSCISGGTTCVVSDSAGKALYATNVSSSSSASWSLWSGVSGESPSEAVACVSTSLCLLASGKDEGNGGNLYYATLLGGSWSLAYGPGPGVDAISCVSTSFCADGQDGGGDFRWSTSPASTSWNLQSQGSAAMKAVSCLSTSFCAIADSKGSVHVATTTSQIKSSAWTETNVDGSTALNGIGCMSKSLCVAVDGSGNALVLKVESSGAVSTTKHDIDGTTSLTAVACPSGTSCVAVDTTGHVLVTTNSGETWSTLYSLGDDLTSVSCASASLCVAADTTGKVTAFNLTGTGTEGEAHASQPGSAIEYRVPVSGGGVPQNLSKEEVEKWGQKDDPVEGTAIVAADEPQGWPASKYTRATIDYMDEEGRTVNAVAPTGGVATTEYNEANEVTRSLSADNRAAAMAEGCVSLAKKECRSAEAAEKLSVQTEYNLEDSEIVKTLGPEHKIKLSNGEEVEARAVTRNYYDEGAEEFEEKNNEEYNLLTKSVSAAELLNGEERERRTTLTGYSGQEGLGWTLREPTSTTVDPAGLDLVSSTKYNKETGAVEETRSPGGNAETVSPPVFASTFGKAGSGEGQFKEASAVAVGNAGEVFVDDRGDGRIEKFSSSGIFEASYESKLGKFSGSWGIAVSPKTGDVFVADSGHNTIFVFSPAGVELRSFGSSGKGALSEPTGISVTPAGEVWVADYGANKVEGFTEEGVYLESVGEGHLKEPGDVSVDNGELYVTSEHSVAMFTREGEYAGSFGSHGSGAGQFGSPTEIVADPGTGDLFVVDGGNERVEEFNPAGKFLTEWGAYGSGEGEFSGISGLAISASGTIYTSETGGDRVQEFTPAQAGAVREVYSTQWGSAGSGHGEFLYTGEPAITSSGHVLVTDNEADDVQEFTPQGKYLATYGSKGEGNGQMSGPTGLTVNQSTGEILVAECANDRIQVLKSEGKYVREFGRGQLSCPGAVALDSSGDAWVADSDKNRIVEYGPTGTLIASYGSEGTGHVQFDDPSDIKILGSDVYVSDTRNDRIEILNLKGEWVGQIGSEGNGGGQFKNPEGIAFNSASDLFVLDAGNNRIEEFNPEGHYLQSIATHGVGEGQLNAPQGIAVTAAGDIYVADAGDHRVEKWTPDSQATHDTKTIYYSPEKEAGVEACENHPEWASLPCRTEPLAQPEDAKEGDPSLPASTMTYNIWDEVLVTKEEFGAGAKAPVREKIQTYDAAGRALTSEEKAYPAGEEGKPIDTALPQVTNEYNSETGALEKQSATIKSEAKTTSAKDNTLGQLVEYKDAEGNTAKYTYEEGGDARLLEVSEGKGEEGKSKQTYIYNATTGFMEKLVDSAAGTFTASYDLEGKLASEVYPNGMCANTSYDPVGMATSISYIKTRNCSETGAPVWFSDSQVPGVYGETIAQTSTLASENYTYDSTGRLLEAQETPAGKGCGTRVYAYDEESNRTSLTTRAPGGEGKCATEGGTVQRHVYDEANRLTDEGIEYEAFGNTTKLPAADAEGHEIKSTYYLDNQVATQEQNHVLDSYLYDPAGRAMQTSSENTETKAKTTLVSHYAGPGEAVTWTSEGTEKWSKNIPGIDGSLQAIEETDKVVVLQLHDLQGNIVATAADNETETKLISTYNSTEFGVPNEGKTPPKYAWLGANGLATETAFGTGVSTQGGASYVPQVARDLQTAPVVPPGAFPNGIGGGEQYTATISAGELASAQATATQIFQEAEAARQEAKKREAEEAAKRQEEAEGGEEGADEEEVIGSIVFTPTGGGAHAADVITCLEIEVDHPHRSTHLPETVNWIVRVVCTAPVLNLRMRLVLNWEGKEISETGYIEKGDVATAKQNVTATCISGWFRGWAYADLTPPPGYEGSTKVSGWSKRRYVKCD